MRKYIYSGVCLALGLGLMANNAFAIRMGASVPAKVYYCSATTTFSTSSCALNSTSSLLPTSTVISDTAVNALGVQNPGTIGAVMGGTSPNILWSYIIGTGASVSGLAMTASSLAGTGTPSNTIAVTAYYVPCGTSPTADGKLSGSPTGTLLNATPVTVANTGSSCTTGANVYFKLDPANALDSNGFVTPDDYEGDINLTVAALTGP